MHHFFSCVTRTSHSTNSALARGSNTSHYERTRIHAQIAMADGDTVALHEPENAQSTKKPRGLEFLPSKPSCRSVKPSSNVLSKRAAAAAVGQGLSSRDFIYAYGNITFLFFSLPRGISLSARRRQVAMRIMRCDATRRNVAVQGCVACSGCMHA